VGSPEGTVAATSPLEQPPLGREDKVVNPDAGRGDLLGTDLALFDEGNRLVVGAPDESLAGGGEGAVHVFERTGDGWDHVRRIIPPDHATVVPVDFGATLAAGGGTLLVGDPFQWVNDTMWAGVVYTFELENGTWAFDSKIVQNVSRAYQFGRSVAVDGDEALVQAFAAYSEPPRRTHILTRENGTWSEVEVVEDTATMTSRGLAIDGSTALLADITDGAGVVHVLERGPAGWERARTLEDPTPHGGDDFGRDVDLARDRAMVGEFTGYDAHVFERDSQGWKHQVTLTKPTGASSSFGYPVALHDDLALVGAMAEEMLGWQVPPDLAGSEGLGNDAGALYVYERTGDATSTGPSWEPRGRITALDARGGDQFGNALDVENATVAVGAYADDHGEPPSRGLAGLHPYRGTSNEGSAYVLSHDTDRDRLADTGEDWLGTVATDGDSDGDGVRDGTEAACDWDPRDPSDPAPSPGPVPVEDAPTVPVGEQSWWLCTVGTSGPD
jgi:hypothetical protein